jgi:hypothetical protein
MLGANDGRRLSDQSILKVAYKNVKAVCAEAWTKAQPDITAIYEDITVLGRESQVADHEADMRRAYGDDYCDFPGMDSASSSDVTSRDCGIGAGIVEVGGEMILSPEIPDGHNGFVACPGGGQIALRCDDGTVTETLRSADCGAASDGTASKRVTTLTSEFVLSQKSLGAMIANPAAAVSGLKNGIAEGLGAVSSAVEIKRTVPDLLGNRRLAEGLRIDATLIVDFDVAVADSAVAARVDSFTSGQWSVMASVTSEVERGLAAQNIEVTIVSVAASAVASPSPGDCEPGAVYVEVEGSAVASPKILEGESHAYSCPSGGEIIFECKKGNVVEKFRTTDCSMKAVSATLMYGLSGAVLLFRIRI